VTVFWEHERYSRDFTFRSAASEHKSLSLLKMIQPPKPFPHDPLVNGTLWYVHYAIVSALESRIVIVSATSIFAPVVFIRL